MCVGLLNSRRSACDASAGKKVIQDIAVYYMYLSDIVFQMSCVLPLSLTLSMHSQGFGEGGLPLHLPPSISKVILRSLLHPQDTPGSTLHVSK